MAIESEPLSKPVDRSERLSDGQVQSGIQPGELPTFVARPGLRISLFVTGCVLAGAAIIVTSRVKRRNMRRNSSRPTLVITGVSSGIGHAAAVHAIEQGAHVFGSVRSEADAARLQEELGAAFTPLLMDLRCEAAVMAEASRVRGMLGGRTLTGLVNNAGVAIPGPVLFQPLTEIREQIETDLIGQIIATRVFAPLLGADPAQSGLPGRIVMMSSIAGELGQPFLSGYVAAKHGIEGFADTLRRELRTFGIDVVTIGPALVDTPIWDKAAPYLGRYAATPYGSAFDRGLRTMVTAGHDQSMAPETIARLVWTALTTAHPQARYAPARHPLFEQGLSRALPRRWLDTIFGVFLGLKPAR